MSWQLTLKSGAKKGASWSVGAQAIVLGRSRECDIAINDPTVSRKHCRIEPDGERIKLIDLGSSNTTLVNGSPMRNCGLKVGDEIAIGSALFIVTGADHDSGRNRLGESDSDTKNLASGDTLPSLEDHFDYSAQGKPRTVQEYAEIFEFGRSLSQATTEHELIALLVRGLERRFGKVPVWFALYDSVEQTLHSMKGLSGLNGDVPAPVFQKMRTVFSERRGCLMPRREPVNGTQKLVTTLIAPISVGGEGVGVLAIQNDSSVTIYDENDLEFFVALAHTVAPFFHTVEKLERLRRHVERLQGQAGDSVRLLGPSREMDRVRSLLHTAGESGLNTLITGETGTGKELAAHLVHILSPRSTEPFVVVNCAAIPSDLFESELFGYEKGAFTGAVRKKIGLVEQAAGGTLFLDEIGDLSPENQARILRVIEYGSFYRVGAERETRVEFCSVSATNRNLRDAVEKGEFREDLFHRLAGISIEIPPLRARTADIRVLAQHFFEKAVAKAKHPVREIDDAGMAFLESRAWHGNARELRNCIDRAVSMATIDRITVETLKATVLHESSRMPNVLRSLEDIEREHIVAVLRHCSGNISAAAQILQIHRNTLYNKIEKYAIEV